MLKGRLCKNYSCVAYLLTFFIISILAEVHTVVHSNSCNLNLR